MEEPVSSDFSGIIPWTGPESLRQEMQAEIEGMRKCYIKPKGSKP